MTHYQLEKENKELTFLAYTLIVLFIISLFGITYQQTKITQYEKDIVMTVKDVAYRQKQIDDINATMQGYKDANEQLIKFCRPCDVNRAIVNTPLPKMKRGKSV